MRPRTLAEVVGQGHLIGEHGTLTRQLRHGHLASMILWGPPGVGKTTLARLLADAAGARFETLSAVMSGVADVRALIAAAAERSATGGPPTVLFIDEIHRFNKGQQDALLPHVEAGTITLIGATTENPYHEVNSALLSRTRVMRLEPLTDEHVTTIVRRALADERGYGGRVGLEDDALGHLVEVSGGDARIALNVLEAAIALADGGSPTREMIEAAAQQRVLAYDRAGDGHYDTVSALIKSVRGNDPDAALYWLATMVAAGEDPRFIARRLIILASEDIGNADPRGLQLAVAAALCARLGRPARGAVRPGPGDGVPGQRAEVEPRRHGLLGGHGRRPAARFAARAVAPAQRDVAGAARLRDGGGVPLPARVRGCRRRPAVPARRAGRAALLRAVRPGAGEADRRAARAVARGPRGGAGASRRATAGRARGRSDAGRRQGHAGAGGAETAHRRRPAAGCRRGVAVAIRRGSSNDG